ncbi:ribonuclease E/G [Pseudaestuariivita atlantica]|uniref:Ribonuclease G n=1 Tax=Pseudaestuariivita atlantica TaxID=1317121 RepID=A0A0L1JW72_9RHOB|nr:ribonuclease E/G [Pseudaestuariivita atlantica]KNG95658.1 ribonuclease G [Pseudaestuariivita atlantica]
MKGALICLDHLGGREAAARMVDGRLEDLFIASDAPRPGAIYAATTGKPAKGQGGLFLDAPGAKLFLRQGKGIGPGEVLKVQVTSHAEPGKAIPVTPRLLFKSRYVIVTPDAPGINVSRAIRDEDRAEDLRGIAHGVTEGVHGLILRSACAEAEDGEIVEDIAAMEALADEVLAAPAEPALLHPGDGPHVLAWRDWTDPAEIDTADGSFAERGVLDALEDLRSPRVELDGGASMFVEPTRALVAVDVNTGRDTSFAAGLKANLAAVRDLPRQLRLRGLGGQVTLDLAPMPKKDRRTVESALKAALRADGVETNVVGWTPLGHLELQRARARTPILPLLPKE